VTTATTAYLGGQDRRALWPGSIVDADVHCNVPSLEALFPYMEPVYEQIMRERGWLGPAGTRMVYPPNAPTTARAEWRPRAAGASADAAAGTHFATGPSGTGVPASSLELVQREILEPWAPDAAILTCYYGVDSLRHPDWAIALASAVNDYVRDQYLDRDDRLRASIVVPARDPQAMIDEIERVAEDPRFVQVLLPVRSDRLYGQRVYHPVLEAIARHGLVLGLHWGGTTDLAPSPSGPASYYVEEYAAEWQVFAAQLTSLVAEGAFQRYPELRVSVLEGGFTWLPGWAWRMNKEWKGLRREVPWVDRLPFDIIREHFRFSIAPLDAGPPKGMRKIVEWLGSEEILMFATDYPHWHDDDLAEFLGLLSPTMRSNVMAESARAWYRL
jgi:predicted TIM-barrel fold metal-dependent hydrolase